MKDRSDEKPSGDAGATAPRTTVVLKLVPRGKREPRSPTDGGQNPAKRNAPTAPEGHDDDPGPTAA